MNKISVIVLEIQAQINKSADPFEREHRIYT